MLDDVVQCIIFEGKIVPAVAGNFSLSSSSSSFLSPSIKLQSAQVFSTKLNFMCNRRPWRGSGATLRRFMSF
jgi:hypothetical protein